MSFIALLFFLLGIRKDKKVFWILSGFFLVFSFFSKQVPSAYVGIFFTVILIFKHFLKNETKNYFYFFYSGITGVFLFLGFFFINGIPLENFIIQYILYPLTIGENRVESYVHNFKNTILEFEFIYISILPLIIIFFNKS